TIDKSSILPTIHSRSQHIHIKGETEDRTRFLEGLSDAELNTVDVLALNAQHVKDLGENFSSSRKAAAGFSSKWIGNHPLVLIEIKPMLDICTERSDHMLLLHLFDGVVRQSMHAPLGLESYRPFGDEQEQGNNSILRVAGMLDDVQSAHSMLQPHVHPLLVFESRLICSQGC